MKCFFSSIQLGRRPFNWGLPCGIRSHDERNQLGQPNELANGQNGKPAIIQFSLPFELITWHI
jgi:hypothetical protein